MCLSATLGLKLYVWRERGSPKTMVASRHVALLHIRRLQADAQRLRTGRILFDSLRKLVQLIGVLAAVTAAVNAAGVGSGLLMFSTGAAVAERALLAIIPHELVSWRLRRHAEELLQLRDEMRGRLDAIQMDGRPEVLQDQAHASLVLEIPDRRREIGDEWRAFQRPSLRQKEEANVG